MKCIFPNELTRKSKNKSSFKLLQNMLLHQNTMMGSVLFWHSITAAKKYNKFSEINHKNGLIGATKAVFQTFMTKRLDSVLSRFSLAHLWYLRWIYIFRSSGSVSDQLVSSLETTEKLECLLNSLRFSGTDITKLGNRAPRKYMRHGNRNLADSSLLSNLRVYRKEHIFLLTTG